jgi:hypothetical protein
LGRLAPDPKTIANFRKGNTQAINRVYRESILLCRKLGLFAVSLVAIDGSKFKVVNDRNRNFTRFKIKHRLKREIEQPNRIEQELKETPDGQVSHTDPHSKATTARGTG